MDTKIKLTASVS